MEGRKTQKREAGQATRRGNPANSMKNWDSGDIPRKRKSSEKKKVIKKRQRGARKKKVHVTKVRNNFGGML